MRAFLVLLFIAAVIAGLAWTFQDALDSAWTGLGKLYRKTTVLVERPKEKLPPGCNKTDMESLRYFVSVPPLLSQDALDADGSQAFLVSLGISSRIYREWTIDEESLTWILRLKNAQGLVVEQPRMQYLPPEQLFPGELWMVHEALRLPEGCRLAGGTYEVEAEIMVTGQSPAIVKAQFEWAPGGGHSKP